MGIFLIQRAKYLASIFVLVTSYNPSVMQLASNQSDSRTQQYNNYQKMDKATSFQVANTPTAVNLPPLSNNFPTQDAGLKDSDLASVKNRLSDINAQVTSIETNKGDIETKLARATEEIKELEQTITNTENELLNKLDMLIKNDPGAPEDPIDAKAISADQGAHFHNELALLKSDNDQLKQSFAQLENEKTTLESKYNGQLAKLNKEKQSLIAKLNSAQEKISNLQKGKKEKTTPLHKQLAKLENENILLKTDLTKRKETETNLHDKLSDLINKEARLETKLAKLQEEKFTAENSYNTELTALKQENESLTQALDQSNMQIASLKQAVNATETKNNDEITKLMTGKQSLQQQLAENNKQLESLTASYNKQIARLNEDNQHLTGQIEKLKKRSNKRGSSQADPEELILAQNRFEDQLKDSRETINKLTQEKNKLEIDLLREITKLQAEKAALLQSNPPTANIPTDEIIDAETLPEISVQDGTAVTEEKPASDQAPPAAQTKDPETAAQAEAEPAEEKVAPADHESFKGREYRIGLDDVLFIHIWQEEDLSREVIVRPDGKISFPLAGDVQAQGLTFNELKENLSNALQEFLKFPVVSISLTKIGGNKVVILGQVMKPGVYAMKSNSTALELIALAGDFTRDAVPESTILIRGGLKNPQGERIDLAKAINEGDASQNVLLLPEDILFVPRKFISKVSYVLNQILQPIQEGRSFYESFSDGPPPAQTFYTTPNVTIQR